MFGLRSHGFCLPKPCKKNCFPVEVTLKHLNDHGYFSCLVYITLDVPLRQTYMLSDDNAKSTLKAQTSNQSKERLVALALTSILHTCAVELPSKSFTSQHISVVAFIIGYHCFGWPYRFPVFCALIAFGWDLSLYSVLSASLTKVLLQYYSSLQPF